MRACVCILLKALVNTIVWFNCNVTDVVNVVIFYLILISDTTHEFLSGIKYRFF